MQAVILAAGMGKRLKELTKDNTKCMVKVNGEPLIDRVLGQLSHLNLNRVVIVVGYERENLMTHIGDRYAGKLNIEYIENPIYDKTNNIYSLALAREKLLEDDTLLLESDLIFDEKMLSLILENPYPNLALVAKYETWMDGTMVRIDEDNNIISFINKSAFQYSAVDQYYKTVNIYKFSREFMANKYLPFLDAYCSALGNNEYYEQVLRVICMLENADLKALPITDEKWYEIDDVQDLDIAEALFAGDDAHYELYTKRQGGYWRFPGMLDFTGNVNPYFPSRRLKDEMRANFDILLTERPSGMYVNSLIAGKCFGVKQDYIVPGNDAAELMRCLTQKLSGELDVFVPQAGTSQFTAEDVICHYEGQNVNSILIMNPSIPSGSYIALNDLLRVESWAAESGIRLVVDETFVDFAPGYPDNTLLNNEVLEKYPELVVIRSVSDTFGVSGLRLGIMASADKELMSYVKNDASISALNSFAEFFLQIYTKHESDYKKSVAKFIKERARLQENLGKVPFLKVFDSHSDCILCEVIAPITSHDLAAKLLREYDILITDSNPYVRVAVRSKEDNDKLVDALMAVL